MTHDYERVIIQGRLVCQTPLSIGTGVLPKVIDAGKDREPANRLDICIRGDDLPYIPGSSLRGLLSALLPKDHNHLRLFGSARGENNTQAGQLRVFDAVWQACERQRTPTQNRTRTRIEPITGTSKDNCLYDLVQVPAYSEFRCEFEMDRIDRTTVQLFLGLLNSFNGSNALARLGRGVGKSEGQVVWTLDSVKTLSPARLVDWLLKQPVTDLANAFFLDDSLNKTEPVIQGKRQFTQIPLHLKLQAPLLVDSERPDDKKNLTNQDKRDNPPDMFFRKETHNGKTCLVAPASSLRGLLRSHCRKILMTILVENTQEAPPFIKAGKKADDLLKILFGSEERASALIFHDATGENVKTHRQTFNAVDRFTGGVADSALYTVEAAWVETLKTKLRINHGYLHKQNNWWKGLLVLALRDAMEGDLALGWGKAKGYGVFTVEIKVEKGGAFIQRWDDLKQSHWKNLAKDWVKSLHDLLNQPL